MMESGTEEIAGIYRMEYATQMIEEARRLLHRDDNIEQLNSLKDRSNAILAKYAD